MARVSFFKALISNLKCAVCRNKRCPVRYYPERKKYQIHHGTRFVTSCEKDRKKFKF